ncbi:GNAT family N-acetyltransferase [Klebsiella sp. BIGb0407]|uniref:GNAT family N-acetyltransferase n=1 Tax=Klebsiella sp. BIGb0407 TaxID=2940603 RepID=UPI0021670D25|nr:GNAT family N-acetyltransferase [Klebsiella sp. BIGb0407]MCS3430631.1 GNAT superfamily N-acetyltransferase [Klebsiella sp. BIGb0407]
MKIRKFTESDRPFLQEIYLQARRKTWSWLDANQWKLEDFDNVTQDESIWVAELAGKQVGFASVWTPDNFLHHLFVSPEAQGHGVGSALLQYVQCQFTDTGSLKCLLDNRHALIFYQRHGWHVEAQGESPDGRYCLMHYSLPA